jgi:hypothetical protein
VSPRWARPWFAVTALCVIGGVALSVYSAVKNPGYFHSGVERGFNAFAFFTVQSNLIVGGTTVLLAIRLDRTSTVFRTFRLIGLVAIAVTGVVYHVALARIFDLDGIDQLGNQLVHTVVPLLAVLGWLMFGPRGQISRRVVWLSLLYPACWLVFTLIRGAVIHWYPYPFINVVEIGYGKAILNAFWVSLLLLGLAAGAAALDSRLGPRGPGSGSGDLAGAGTGHRSDLPG